MWPFTSHPFHFHFLSLIILSISQSLFWHFDFPHVVPRQMPFTVLVQLANSDSLLVAQISVAWLGFQRGCNEEKHFCRWLVMGCPPVSPGLVVAFSASREWDPGDKRWQPLVTETYRQTVRFPQVKMSESQKSPKGLSLRRKLITWMGRFKFLAKSLSALFN